MNIKATVKTKQAEAFLAALQEELDMTRMDLLVDRVAFETHRRLVEDTKAAIGVRPDGSRWNIEQPENKWMVTDPGPGMRVVENGNEVMRYLDQGTADGGTGYITPKTKKFLFIPLSRRAAAGWTKALKWGVDYVLAKRVKGIRPRNIVAPVREEAQRTLTERATEFVREAVRRAKAKAASVKD